MLILLPLLACAPADGLLSAGIWGGDHYSLEIAADGSAYLEADCAHAAIPGPVEVIDGAVEIALEYELENGVEQIDTAAPELWPGTLRGDVRGDTLSGTLEITIDGETYSETLELVLGEEPNLTKCL